MYIRLIKPFILSSFAGRFLVQCVTIIRSVSQAPPWSSAEAARKVSEMLRRAGAWSRHATRLCGSDISPATTGQSCRLYNMLQGCPHVSNLLNPEPATCSSCSSRDCGSDDPMSVSGGAAAASAPGSSAWDSVDLEGSPMAPERTLQAPRVLQPKKLRKNGSNDHP